MSDINNLINDIISDLQNETKSFVNTLRKALVLAEELNHNEFKQWIIKEIIDGYKIDENIPNYRILKNLVIKGHFITYSMQADWEIPISFIPETVRDAYENYKFIDPISELEKLLNDQDTMVIHIPAQLAHSFSNKVYKNASCMNAYMVLTKGHFARIYESAKTRLLLFLLEIKKQYPDIISINIPTEHINKLLKTIIYNVNGNDNIIVNNIDSPNSDININTMDELISFLKPYLKTTAIEEIKQINQDNINKKTKVSDWIKNLPSKVLEKIILEPITIEKITKVVLNFFNN